MNTELILTLVALTVQALALVFWLRLFRKVERWVWWFVSIGFLIMGSHRIGELLNYNVVPEFNSVTAVLIALTALVAVLQTNRWIRRREKQQRALKSVQRKLEALQSEVTNRDSIATRVAEIIGDLRQQIEYYRHQADAHQLPHYENGGHDRTRTG